MNKKLENLFMDICLYISYCDGEHANAEFVASYKRLTQKFPKITLETYKDRSELFHRNYNKQTELFFSSLRNFSQLSKYKQELLEFARKVALDDTQVLEQENYALLQLEKILDK